ncbi:hypothetical protein RBH26_16670 [Natronolimnohabitans sp. A-GB9]|uniref:hypothetical protein n=1 Tax=Natronolimnohabitans sp. A-GB9 TaxID=3069757 RepID=UPI0027B548D0|nr:hypothetical protein [Natronolimnohabitans sp. A-GB9]MDQ2052113.1 hypothetical protein [Natronolimnohabitans sp. A-GB9]
MTTTDRDRPTPPTELDDDARAALSTLEERDVDQLRAAGEYLKTLAAWKVATNGEQDDGDETDESDREYPPGVPERASVTIKEIAGTTYTYYQWRDGDRIESKTVKRE